MREFAYDRFVKEFAYDWFGLNELLFSALYSLNFPSLGSIWNLLWFAYGYLAVALVGLVLCARYLKIRHTAREREIDAIGNMLATLILSLTSVVCIVVTVQNVMPLPRPWDVLPGRVDAISLNPWHEGFPATNAAIALMFATIFWRYASKNIRLTLICYAVIGCLGSVIVGIHFPADIVAGALVGVASVYVARYIMKLGARIVAIP